MSGDYAMTPAERALIFKRLHPNAVPRGYAAAPGTGPDGETCGSCRHHTTRRYSKVYHKCALMEAVWTGGGGTDIRVRSSACAEWERPA